MYNLQKNNFHKNPKKSNIQTPLEVSQFIFELLKDKIKPNRANNPMVLDPCSGQGNLLEPWTKTGYRTFGVDIDPNSQPGQTLITDFLQLKTARGIGGSPDLVLCNPPFNGYGKKLGSEVWLDKIIELFGKGTPIAVNST